MRYVNIGAYVDEGTMVDMNNVGSCAQIGKVHLSGGVGIGGVLEPLQAAPVMKMVHWISLYRC
jgi:2,3,4,5-tetrahydropyridine-2-carboxylate N-succinyltransferase